MHGDPLVSCVCVTRNRVGQLRRAVSCFLNQTYQNRELVVLYETDDPGTRDYLATLTDASIRSVEVPAAPRLRLGSLRNLSLQASQGHYVAQWDDDDWHAPTRLEAQVRAIRTFGGMGCVLDRWIIYDMESHRAFLSARRAWEGSLVAERTAMPLYPDLCRGEDTPLIQRLVAEDKLVFRRVSVAVARHASHKSVRAQFGHTARQVTDSPSHGKPSGPQLPLAAEIAPATR